MVHCRDAFADVVATLEGEGPPPRVVFHCFAGDERAAVRVVEAGWYVSFAGTVTFRNAPGCGPPAPSSPWTGWCWRPTARSCPPLPGRPNRPGRVAITAQTVAEVHGVGVEEVAASTTATAAEAFGLALTAVPEPPPRPC